MRALVVQNSAEARDEVRGLLHARSHEVSEARDADSAVRAHQSHPFDLIVIDCALPGRSGYELARIVRSMRLHNPFLLLLADQTSPGDLSAALEAGADDYLLKPVDPDLFKARVALAERRAQETQRRVKAERGQQRSERSFRSLIEAYPDGIAVLQANRIVYVNPAMVSYLGFEREEDLFGVDAAQHFGSYTSRNFDRNSISSVPPSPVAPTLTQRDIRGRDAQPMAAEVMELPIVFDGERAVLLVARDLSEQKKMQIRAQLADRLASVGTLAAGAAHELNNPLAYVTGNLKLLAEELGRLESGLPATTLKLLRDLVADSADGAERMSTIVRDLKTFARSDDARTGPMDLRPVVESSLNMAWNQIRHRARLVKSLKATPNVEANESRIGQVVVNLLMNAAQALPEGHASQHEIAVRTWTDEAGWAILEVTDTGPGIPQAIRARIFDPFFTTKSDAEGTGLGLSICHQIVTTAGGEIILDSEEGRGTRVRIRLPRAHRAASKRPSLLPQARAASTRARVLIVDDEPLVSRALKRALREHEVVVANNGLAAIQHLSTNEHFDVVFCDLMMPDLTGMDVYGELQKNHPGKEKLFVFMTGGAFTSAARDFLDTVPNERIEKPFDIETVRKIVLHSIGAASP